MQLVLKNKNGNYYDYAISDKFQEVGILQTVESDDSIFMRQIRVFENFKRNGYASAAVKEILKRETSVGLCISTHSSSAMPFWMSFFNKCKNTGYDVENTKGNSWVISKQI